MLHCYKIFTKLQDKRYIVMYNISKENRIAYFALQICKENSRIRRQIDIREPENPLIRKDSYHSGSCPYYFVNCVDFSTAINSAEKSQTHKENKLFFLTLPQLYCGLFFYIYTRKNQELFFNSFTIILAAL